MKIKKFYDFLGDEISDPWSLKILQRLDRLKKRNKGRKHFSEEDEKELNAIVEEINKDWEIPSKGFDKNPISRLSKERFTGGNWQNG